MDTVIPLGMEAEHKARAIKWIMATILTPLAASFLCANCYIALWYMRMAAAGTPHTGSPPMEVVQRGVMATSSVGLWLTVGLWWWLNRKRDTFATLFDTRTKTWAREIALGLMLGAGWVLVYGWLGWPSFSEMFRFDWDKLASVPTSLSAGFCEEFLFRGFVILLLARAGMRSRAQLAWSSVAFGAAHLLWGPVGMLFTVVLGASLAAVTLWRRNVWPAVAAHTLLDLCIEPALLEKALTFQNP